MKKISIFFILISFSLSVLAQRESVKLDTNYKLAKIYLKNNAIKKIKNLTINEKGIASFMEPSGKQEEIPIDDFRLVKIKIGSNALAYSLYGAGFMAASSFLTLVDIETDPNVKTKENTGVIIAGFIVGGAAIGAFVGAISPKWKTFNLPKINKDGSASYTFSPAFNPINNAISFRLNIKF